MAKLYGISSLEEAEAFYNDEILGKRLIEISQALFEIQDKLIIEIFGYVDSLKCRSCMTLFSLLKQDTIFDQVIEKYYKGMHCIDTINYINHT
jgi:uncharacterized protein (DUF1810 family)